MTPVVLFLLFVSLSAVPSRAMDDEVLSEDSSDVSLTIARVNSDTKTTLIHGDILPSSTSSEDADADCTEAGCMWPKEGQFVDVPFDISSEFNAQERSFIINSLRTFNRSTCIRLIQRKSSQSSYIHFYPGDGCFSSLGHQGGKQKISLKRNGCLSLDVVQHEVLHALGFHHEHVRSDRDGYVSIVFENVDPGKESNFGKENTNNLNTPYDFDSVMHYSNFAFSRNGQPTIVAKSDPDLMLGHEPQMSQADIDRVNKFYRCSV